MKLPDNLYERTIYLSDSLKTIPAILALLNLAGITGYAEEKVPYSLVSFFQEYSIDAAILHNLASTDERNVLEVAKQFPIVIIEKQIQNLPEQEMYTAFRRANIPVLTKTTEAYIQGLLEISKRFPSRE